MQVVTKIMNIFLFGIHGYDIDYNKVTVNRNDGILLYCKSNIQHRDVIITFPNNMKIIDKEINKQ